MPGGNPLANILLVIVATIVIGVSLVLGFFAFLIVSAIVLLAATVIGIRSWWAQRGLPDNGSAAQGAATDVIEGEFHVVKKRKNS